MIHRAHFFPWMGGKSAVAARLAAILPDHRCYVELFAGAANVLLAKDRPPGSAEILNDVNDDLVNLFRVVRCHSRALITELAYQPHARSDFSAYRRQQGLTDIQRAGRYLAILTMSFGGTGGTTHPTFGYGTTGRSKLNASVISTIRRVARRLEGVTVEHLDFADCIKRYDRPHTVFFADPPYYQTAGYADGFGREDHARLAKRLAGIKGRFLMTINDHKVIRDLYHGFTIRRRAVRYSVSRKKDAASQARRAELLIANYPLPKRINW